MLWIILGLIALGLVVFTVVALNLKWFLNRLRSKKTAMPNIKKVMLADLSTLANSCDNTVKLDQLRDLVDKGITHVMADIDDDGNVVGNIEAIKDTNQSLDDEVNKILGQDRMVVVEV